MRYILFMPLLLLMFLPACNRYSVGDSVTPFSLDAHQPFQIQLGRGSGWHGLDVVIVDQTGHVTLSQQPRRSGEMWKKTDLTLAPSLIEEIVSKVNRLQLTSLARTYSTHNVADGTQWVFYATQGTHTKVIYFDNNFPRDIKEFADALDNVLDRGGLSKAAWTQGGKDLNDTLWQLQAKK